MNEKRPTKLGDVAQDFGRMWEILRKAQDQLIASMHDSARRNKDPGTMIASDEFQQAVWAGELEDILDNPGKKPAWMDVEVPEDSFNPENIAQGEDPVVARILLLMMNNGLALPNPEVNETVSEIEISVPEIELENYIPEPINEPATDLPEPETVLDTPITVFDTTIQPEQTFDWPEELLEIKAILENIPGGYRRSGTEGINEYIPLQLLKEYSLKNDLPSEKTRVQSMWNNHKTRLKIEGAIGSEIGLPKDRKTYFTIAEVGRFFTSLKRRPENWIPIEQKLMSLGQGGGEADSDKNHDNPSNPRSSEPVDAIPDVKPGEGPENLPDINSSESAGHTSVVETGEKKKVLLARAVYLWIKNHPRHHMYKDDCYITQGELAELVFPVQDAEAWANYKIINGLVIDLQIRKVIGSTIGVSDGSRSHHYIELAGVIEIVEELIRQKQLNFLEFENLGLEIDVAEKIEHKNIGFADSDIPPEPVTPTYNKKEELVGEPLVCIWGDDLKPQAKGLRQIISDSNLGRNINGEWLARKIIGNIEKGSDGITYITEDYLISEIIFAKDWAAHRNDLFKELRVLDQRHYSTAEKVGFQHRGMVLTVNGLLAMIKVALNKYNATLRSD